MRCLTLSLWHSSFNTDSTSFSCYFLSLTLALSLTHSLALLLPLSHSLLLSQSLSPFRSESSQLCSATMYRIRKEGMKKGNLTNRANYYTLWIHCMWFLSCSRSLMYPSQISQMTKLPLPCGWPGLAEGLGLAPFLAPGLPPRPGSAVIEILGLPGFEPLKNTLINKLIQSILS